MPVTKREEVTKKGFCKILGRKLRFRGSPLLVLIQFQFQSHFHSSEWGGGGRVFEFDCEWEGGGRLLTFFAFRMGAHSRWTLIRGWALIRLNTVYPSVRRAGRIVKVSQRFLCPLSLGLSRRCKVCSFDCTLINRLINQL